MHSTLILAALSALSIGQAVAGPAHAHLHRKKDLTKKDDGNLANVDWEKIPWAELKVDWNSVNYDSPSVKTTAAVVSVASSVPTSSVPAISTTLASVVSSAASTASATASASASASTSASSGGSSTSGIYNNLFNNVAGAANGRTSFGGRTASSGDEVSYIANVGNPYASNMMVVSDASGYLYTVTFVNTTPDVVPINIWNKAGSNGMANSGCTDAPKSTSLTFNVAPGGSVIVAVDENTVIAATYATNNIAPSGAFANTWFEMKFKDKDCGYNVSKIMNTGRDYKVSMSSKECSCVSSDTENNWITDAITTGSGSCYVNVGGMHLTITLGGPK